MERIELSTPNLNFAEIVKHVSRDGVIVELSEGSTPLARIIPISPPRSMTDLDRALRDTVRLDVDSESFAQDVLSVRQSIGNLDDPWES